MSHARIRQLAVVVGILALSATAHTQYFGSNKVPYKPQRFQVLATDHFDVYFHQDERDAADTAGRMAERWRARFVKFFGFELVGRQPLIIYNSHPDFEQTLITESLVDTGTRGFTEPWRRRIVLSFAGPLDDTSHVIGHELVHAFQFDLMAHEPSMLYKEEAAPLPLWLVEGLAEFLTIGPVDPHTGMWLRDGVVNNNLPRIGELHTADWFPYRWGHALLAYMARRWGDQAVADFYRVANLHGIEAGTKRVFDMTLDELSDAWQASIREDYLRSLATAVPPGDLLIEGRRFGGSTNIAPALSPDGRWLAFMSERSFFSVDLFVADARTGQVRRRLTNTAGDPRESSLQFLDSAPAWSRDSRRLAVAAVASGRATISVFQWPDGTRQRDIPVKGVDEIGGLTWAPDGHAIAFAALAGGVTDLFVYDLERLSLRRLTNDTYADLQPAWSPDGRRIAFVTDRFTTDLDTLAFGDYRLALVGCDGGSIEPVTAFAAGKHINPQWTADARSLLFVSDGDGVSNLYRVALADGALTQLTRTATGISGLMASSPSISLAVDDDVVALSVFARGGFAIHTLMPGEGLPVGRTAWLSAASVPATVDPVPSAAAWPVTRYKPRLAFEGPTQGSLAVGVDRFGAAMASGLGVVFSDVLNTRRLVGVVQVNPVLGNSFNLSDMAFYGAFVNRERRWQWGVIGSSLPNVLGVRSTGMTEDGVKVALLSFIRQTERAGTLLTSYAFDRARRVEFQGALGRLTFDRAARDDDGDATWVNAAPPLTVASTSAALVGDTTNTGATSVVSGERYRFEVAPVLGTLRHVSVLADYRKYVMPFPFYTIAVRALHFGRYGKGAEDPRLTPLFLGYPSLVRGLQTEAFATNECVAALADACDEVSPLVGSRIAVGNLELRFPLLRPFGVSPRMYGPVPIEVAAFVDGGVVWRNARPHTAARDATAAWSTGVTFRANIVGLGLGQFDVARPLHGRRAGWVFQFNLVPAF